MMEKDSETPKGAEPEYFLLSSALDTKLPGVDSKMHASLRLLLLTPREGM